MLFVAFSLRARIQKPSCRFFVNRRNVEHRFFFFSLSFVLQRNTRPKFDVVRRRSCSRVSNCTHFYVRNTCLTFSRLPTTRPSYCAPLAFLRHRPPSLVETTLRTPCRKSSACCSSAVSPVSWASFVAGACRCYVIRFNSTV